MHYDVTLAGENVGNVQVRKEGLYLSFQCRCHLSGEVMYHLILRQDAREENLGLLVPVGKAYGLEKKLPAKQVGQGNMRFLLRPRHEKSAGRFVPIRAEEPFAYLRFLGEAFLAVRGGEVGAILPCEKNEEKVKN